MITSATSQFACSTGPKTGPNKQQPVWCKMSNSLSSTACSAVCVLLIVSMARGLIA